MERYILYFKFFGVCFYEGSYGSYEKALKHAKERPIAFKRGDYKIEKEKKNGGEKWEIQE